MVGLFFIILVLNCSTYRNVTSQLSFYYSHRSVCSDKYTPSYILAPNIIFYRGRQTSLN